MAPPDFQLLRDLASSLFVKTARATNHLQLCGESHQHHCSEVYMVPSWLHWSLSLGLGPELWLAAPMTFGLTKFTRASEVFASWCLLLLQALCFSAKHKKFAFVTGFWPLFCAFLSTVTGAGRGTLASNHTATSSSVPWFRLCTSALTPAGQSPVPTCSVCFPALTLPLQRLRPHCLHPC